MTAAIACLLAIAAVSVKAQTTISTMQFQRSVDTSSSSNGTSVGSPGASGNVVLEKQGSKQSFSVNIRNLPGDSFAVLYGVDNSTNTPIFLISVMNRQGTNDNWVLHYEADGAAPSQLPVTNLDDFAGLYLFIGNPSATSNTIVNVVLFAQIPPLTTRSAAPYFNAKSPLTVSTNAPPNPAEKGTVKAAFIGKQGRSLFTLQANHLSGGGAYSIFIEDPPSSKIFTNINTLVLSASTTSGSFSRDTAKGETLPLLLPTTQFLSGRGIQIRDAFDQIHLEGVIP